MAEKGDRSTIDLALLRAAGRFGAPLLFKDAAADRFSELGLRIKRLIDQAMIPLDLNGYDRTYDDQFLDRR